jgi:Domain of unknown function (DUF4417)
MAKEMAVNAWDIPNLRSDRLSKVIPSRVYGGGPIENPTDTLFLWRSTATKKAQGGVLAFYLDDWRIDAIWRLPARYAKQFKECGITELVEVNFSLWRDRPKAEQVFNVHRTRTVSRVFQGYDLRIIPNLSWAGRESFEFCFQGIPTGVPVAAVECRTAGSNDTDRRRFLAGLTEGVRQTQPENVLMYGGTVHKFWLDGSLPPGPVYHWIESWTDARAKVCQAQQQQEREKNQLTLFPGGTDTWADMPGERCFVTPTGVW